MLSGSMIPRAVRRIFDERTEPRELAGEVAMVELHGRKFRARLVNVSPSGAMVMCDLMPHIGDPVWLQIQGRGRVLGHVCWVRDDRIGVNLAAAAE
jgi:hypothetical protein